MSFITYEAISSLLIIITHNKTRKDASAQNGKLLAYDHNSVKVQLILENKPMLASVH